MHPVHDHGKYYLTTADAVEEAHTVLASQFLNEQFALMAGLPEEQQGLGHAFSIASARSDINGVWIASVIIPSK